MPPDFAHAHIWWKQLCDINYVKEPTSLLAKSREKSRWSARQYKPAATCIFGWWGLRVTVIKLTFRHPGRPGDCQISNNNNNNSYYEPKVALLSPDPTCLVGPPGEVPASVHTMGLPGKVPFARESPGKRDPMWTRGLKMNWHAHSWNKHVALAKGSAILVPLSIKAIGNLTLTHDHENKNESRGKGRFSPYM